VCAGGAAPAQPAMHIGSGSDLTTIAGDKELLTGAPSRSPKAGPPGGGRASEVTVT